MARRTFLAAVALALLVPPAPAHAASAARAWDFDGDGHRDLAVGVAGENGKAGAVVTVRGTARGLASSGGRIFSQGTPGIPGVPEPLDLFGGSLASGDFDADGYADLAIGAAGEDRGGFPDAGAVAVLYGGVRGLSASGAHAVPTPEAVFGDTDHEAAQFGYQLAAGDFDDDGDDDLVVATGTGLGGLLVYRGRAAGLATTPAQQIGPEAGLPALDTFYADALAVGDLNDDGVPDLAAGLQNDDQARGAAVVLYGAPGAGLNVNGNAVPRPQVWTQDTEGVKGQAAELDAFGSSVAIADVTGDGRKDLIVGAVQEPNGGSDVIGALHVLRGTRSGVTATGDQYLRYDDLVAEPVGALGTELAAGDIDGDGYADVAVTRGDMDDHRWGAVMVLHGSADGLGAHRKRTFTQATEGIRGANAPVDYWGTDLAIRDIGFSSRPDLIVTDPYEVVDGAADAGMLNVLWGSSSGVGGARSRGLTQDSTGVPGVAEEGDLFGLAV